MQEVKQETSEEKKEVVEKAPKKKKPEKIEIIEGNVYEIKRGALKGKSLKAKGWYDNCYIIPWSKNYGNNLGQYLLRIGLQTFCPADNQIIVGTIDDKTTWVHYNELDLNATIPKEEKQNAIEDKD